MRFCIAVALLPAGASAFVQLPNPTFRGITNLRATDEDLVAAYQKQINELQAKLSEVTSSAPVDASGKTDPVSIVDATAESINSVVEPVVASDQTLVNVDPVVGATPGPAISSPFPTEQVTIPDVTQSVVQSIPDVTPTAQMDTIEAAKTEAVQQASPLIDIMKSNIKEAADSAVMQSAAPERAPSLFDFAKNSAVSAKDVVAEKAPSVIESVKSTAISAKDAAVANTPVVIDTVKSTAATAKDSVAANSLPFVDTVKSNAPSFFDSIKKTAIFTKDAVVTNTPAVINSVKSTADSLKSTAESTKGAVETAKTSGVFDSGTNLIEFAKKGAVGAVSSPETSERVGNLQKGVSTAAKSTVDAGLNKLNEVAPPLIESAKTGVKSSLAQVIQAQQTEIAAPDGDNLKFIAAKIITFAATFGTAVVDYDYDFKNKGAWYLLAITFIWGLSQREAGRKNAQMEFEGVSGEPKEKNIFDSMISSVADVLGIEIEVDEPPKDPVEAVAQLKAAQKNFKNRVNQAKAEAGVVEKAIKDAEEAIKAEEERAEAEEKARKLAEIKAQREAEEEAKRVAMEAEREQKEAAAREKRLVIEAEMRQREAEVETKRLAIAAENERREAELKARREAEERAKTLAVEAATTKREAIETAKELSAEAARPFTPEVPSGETSFVAPTKAETSNDLSATAARPFTPGLLSAKTSFGAPNQAEKANELPSQAARPFIPGVPNDQTFFASPATPDIEEGISLLKEKQMAFETKLKSEKQEGEDKAEKEVEPEEENIMEVEETMMAAAVRATRALSKEKDKTTMIETAINSTTALGYAASPKKVRGSSVLQKDFCAITL